MDRSAVFMHCADAANQLEISLSQEENSLQLELASMLEIFRNVAEGKPVSETSRSNAINMAFARTETEFSALQVKSPALWKGLESAKLAANEIHRDLP